MDPVRFSNLKAIAQSPAHYLHRVRNYDSQKGRPLTVGTAVHSMLLGGAAIVVFSGATRRGKEWDAFKAEHEGAVILSRSEHAAAIGMANAVQRCKPALELLTGETEVELPTWKLCGRECGGRVDVRTPRRVVELKTSVTAQPDRFKRLATRMAYHAQLAWYLDGNAESGGTAREAYVVAVESSPPFVVTPMQLTERMIDAGRKLYRLWFEQLLSCEQANEWPGYVQDIIDFDLDDADDVELTFGEEEDVA